MKLKNYLDDLGGSNCWSGNCPTVYESDRGTFVIQGNLVAPSELNGVDIPSHEGVVEVPESLVRALAEKMAKK